MKRAHKSVRASLRRKRQRGISDSAVVLAFLALIVIIVIVFGAETQETRKDQVKLLNQLVADSEEEDGTAIIVGNSLDNGMLLTLANKDYAELKSLMGITSDFVIYFEDQEGNLVKVIEKPCIGSAHARVNGQRCGE